MDTASLLNNVGSCSSKDGHSPSPPPRPRDPSPTAGKGLHCSKRKLSAFTPEGCQRREELASSCPLYQLVLVGDRGTGKSSFLLRLCTNEFRGDISSTLVTCSPRYRSIAQSYFRKAQGVLLLYDISSPSSFLSARQWIEDIKAMEQTLPLMLVGNKLDLQAGLPEAARVCAAQGQHLAMVHKSLFCETSAKDGTNVVEAVLHLAREVKRTVGQSRGLGAGLDLSIPPRLAPQCCWA
ncbi:hypothetical protein Q9233_009381 [Columba guinea]|nr:hypothetical protein Q9233_009381 [Columba guinea]